MKDFEFQIPTTVEEALDLLDKCGPTSKLLAGGTDLIPQMKDRDITPGCVISLGEVPGLDFISEDEDGIRIGPLATHTALMKSPLINQKLPALALAARTMGSPAIRNAGTIGGNIATASPAADGVPPLLALGASVKLQSKAGERWVALDCFFQGVKKCDIQPNEIITEILVPAPWTSAANRFFRLGKRNAAVLSVVNGAIALQMDGGKTCKAARIALGAVAPTPILAGKASAFLAGKSLSDQNIDQAADLAVSETSPITDARSTAEYRRAVTKTLVTRALQELAQQVK
jgi:xanthine dehydrogenase FAD-binding subunit